MRSIGVAAFAAAVALSAGVATGARAPVPTTMTVTPTMATYGSSVTVSGVVSSQQAGERVTIQARACGEGAFKVAKRVVSRAGGRWSVVIRPRSNTKYRAQVGTATGSVLAVAVGPRLELYRPQVRQPRRYTVSVWAAQALADTFADTVVTFESFNAATRRWVLAKRVVLQTVESELTELGRTFVSSASVLLRIDEGRRVRVVLARRQAAPCYTAGVSNVVNS